MSAPFRFNALVALALVLLVVDVWSGGDGDE